MWVMPPGIKTLPCQSNQNHNVTCVFVGRFFKPPRLGRSGKTAEVNNGWQKELNEFFELTKDDKRFVFAGFVPDSELIKLYQQASLNILPSRDEGFGFSFLEAAQFSCPSVLSDIPVLKEISEENALFSNPGNPQELAEKIGEIYFDKNLRNNIGEKALQRSKFFSSKKFRAEVRSVLDLK
jgi:glycosyltransferase involved in cell wall biosynthesis